MKVVVGLGNPGARYELTRHNIGWLVLDAVAAKLHARFKPGRGDYFEARGKDDLLLVKPSTYMNNSGVAARQVMQRYGIDASDLLVIVDEIQFPPGRIQLKPSGSSGGHNGLESLIYQLESTDFPRLRCGIGSDFEQGEMVDYVLSPFREDEGDQVKAMIVDGVEAVMLWAVRGTAQAMNIINRKAGSVRSDSGNEKDGRLPENREAPSNDTDHDGTAVS